LPWSTTLQTSSVTQLCRQPRESGREGFPLVEHSLLALSFLPFTFLRIGLGNGTSVTGNKDTSCECCFSWNSNVVRIFIYAFFLSFIRATRRRHGIPDSDLRPFNVAYSDAMAKAREEVQRQPRLNSIPRPQVAQVDQRAAHLEQSLRQRSGMSDLS
jgi:hypothetical protein